jgi:deoxycytidine triphosphate deaminase
MILGAEEITKYIKNGLPARFEADGITQKNSEGYVFIDIANRYCFPLVENIPNDFEIEGASVDITIKDIFIKENIDNCISSFLSVNGRNTGDISPAEEVIADTGQKFYAIDTGQQYIATSNEKVNMPLFLLGKPMPRVTMFTAGLLVQVGIIQPNFYGQLKFGLVNMTNRRILIEKGFRAITITFEEIRGGVNAYSGLHQGGQVLSTHNKMAPPR